ncbi:hypothetical protein DL765_011137 [Monosporascus sp. GIB2]|nr:hypothetical protein DL765_011137 [Monosporascus sp. GIB2]
MEMTSRTDGKRSLVRRSNQNRDYPRLSMVKEVDCFAVLSSVQGFLSTCLGATEKAIASISVAFIALEDIDSMVDLRLLLLVMSRIKPSSGLALGSLTTLLEMIATGSVVLDSLAMGRANVDILIILSISIISLNRLVAIIASERCSRSSPSALSCRSAEPVMFPVMLDESPGKID